MTHRRAVWLLALMTVLAGARVSAQQGPVFRTGVDLVNLGVTVSDRKGALVGRLEAGDFEIYEDGRKQDIQLFATGDASGSSQSGPALHLGVLFDASESMTEDITFTRGAAVKFLNTLVDAVDITFVDFDTEVRVARYEQRDFARLVERIRSQKPRGSTALYDAIGVYLDGAAGQDGRKIMLLYTDGGDTRSSMSLKDLLDLLKASDVTVYVIGQLEHQSSSYRGEARALLQRIAEVTGGMAFFPGSVKELDSAYGKAVAEIRAQYTLGYLSTNHKTDGAWRKVEVKVVRRDADGGERRAPRETGEVRVRARKGYFAPYREPGATPGKP